MTGVELTEVERAQVVEAYDHEADAHCWQDHCEDGLWHAVAQIVAARLAPAEADARTAWSLYRSEQADHNRMSTVAAEQEDRAEAAEAEVARLTAERDTHREVAESMSGMWRQELDRANRLEAMCDRMSEKLVDAEDENRRLTALVEAVKALHADQGGGWCAECSTSPCRTRTALGGAK